MSGLLLAGLALIAAGAVVDLGYGLALGRWRSLPYLSGAAGAACLAVVAGAALRGGPVTLRLGSWLGVGDGGLSVDRLSALFLLLVSAIGVAAMLAASGWAARPGQVRGRGVAAAAALALGSTVVVLTADNVFVLVFAWESMTLAFYLLVGAERWRAGRARASLLTVVFGKVSGAALLFGVLLLAAGANSFRLSALGHSVGTRHDLAYALIVVAFAVKIGLVPVQVWLPPGYAAAPAGVRALMAGVAVNAGFYGLWRTLDLLGRPPTWLAVALLIVGGITALLGIAHAAVQTRLDRMVAYSSVENAGLICVGFAVALVGRAVGDARLVAVGLLAATLQVVAHALAKTLLFTATATIEASYGTLELERLRGVGRQLPWAAASFGIGAVTLAGLPPTAGFVSEWFLLESLMQQFRVSGQVAALAMALAGALVALTVGFAGITFVRIIGLTLLGSTGPTAEPARPTAEPARPPADLPAGGRVAALALAVGCLGVAAVTPLEVRVIAAGLGPIVPDQVSMSALASPWVLQPVYGQFSILSPSWLWVVMPLTGLAVVVLLVAASSGRALRVRRVAPWRSATGGVTGADQYTPFGYAHPTRKVLANLLMTRTELRSLQAATGQHAVPEQTEQGGAEFGYTTDVVEVVERYLYLPLRRPWRALVRVAKRLQSGRLDAYVAYMLIVLVAVIAIVTGLS